jgi:hypothetical protein
MQAYRLTIMVVHKSIYITIERGENGNVPSRGMGLRGMRWFVFRFGDTIVLASRLVLVACLCWLGHDKEGVENGRGMRSAIREGHWGMQACQEMCSQHER